MGVDSAPHFWREAFAAVSVSFLLFNNGVSIGWSSPALPSLKLDQDFADKIGSNIAAWIGASLCLTTCGGNILTPFLLSFLGPKKTLLLVVLPMFTTQWAIILLAKPFAAVWIILVGRGVAGLALGITLGVVPSYIIDISSPEYQGLLALGPQLMFSLGLLFVYLLGALVSWWWLSLVCLALQLPMFALLLLVPDSPYSLVMKGRKEQSKEAIYWLTQSESVAEHRLDKMMEDFHLCQKKGGQNIQSILPLLKKPSNWKPLCVSISILAALQLCGVAPLVFFSIKFFRDAKTCVDASLSSIIVSAISLLTVILVCLLGGKFSRRKLMLVSQFGLTSCLFSMALYFLLGDLNMADGIRWLPLLILVLYFILFNIGLSSYVWVITAEILPNEIRDEVIPFAILVSSVLWFLITFFFNAMFESFGGLYLFLFYGLTSLFFSIVSLFFLPETTGKSSEEISKFFINCQFLTLN